MVMRSRNVRRKSIKRKNNKRRRVSKRIKSSRRKSTKKRRVSRRIKRTRNRKISKKRISQKYIRGGNGEEAAGITKPNVGEIVYVKEEDSTGGIRWIKAKVVKPWETMKYSETQIMVESISEYFSGGRTLLDNKYKKVDLQNIKSEKEVEALADQEIAKLLASSDEEGEEEMVEHAGGGPNRDDEQNLSSPRQVLRSKLESEKLSILMRKAKAAGAARAAVGAALDSENPKEMMIDLLLEEAKFTEKPDHKTNVYYMPPQEMREAIVSDILPQYPQKVKINLEDNRQQIWVEWEKLLRRY